MDGFHHLLAIKVHDYFKLGVNNAFADLQEFCNGETLQMVCLSGEIVLLYFRVGRILQLGNPSAELS